ESSMNKVFWSEYDIALQETALDLLGPEGEAAARSSSTPAEPLARCATPVRSGWSPPSPRPSASATTTAWTCSPVWCSR
ncbi:hypothetical protein ACWEGM_20310, partial [Streptomyces nigra]